MAVATRPGSPSWGHGVAITRRCLREGISARAAEAAFFCSLAMFPTLVTVIAVLRAVRPLLGTDPSQVVSQDVSLLLRVVLTARGGVAATSADDVLAGGTDGGLIGVGTVAAVVVLARGVRSPRRGVAGVCDRPVPAAGREWLVAGLAAGAIVTVVGWTVATALVPAYVTVVAHVSPTLGALGGGLIVLVWVYLLALMLLVGAEVIAYNAHRREIGPRPEPGVTAVDASTPGPQ